MTMHTAAAATTNSGITAPTIPDSMVAAIDALLANQTTIFNQVASLFQQMVAFLLEGNHPAQQGMHFHAPQQGQQYYATPIQMLHVPLIPPFAGGGLTLGVDFRGRSTSHCNNGRRYGHGECVCTPFANHMGYGAPVGGTNSHAINLILRLFFYYFLHTMSSWRHKLIHNNTNNQQTPPPW